MDCANNSFSAKKRLIYINANQPYLFREEE